MTRPLPLLSTLAVLFLAIPAFAAPGDAPSMSAGSNSSSSSSPLGGEPMMKDRPKNAKTEITAKKEATFDNAGNIAEFDGTVVVKDPQFTLYCDHLKVTLNKDRKGMDHAFATGNVVLVQENKDDSGKTNKTICRSQAALFEPATGNITLTVTPSVQQGPNLQVATDPNTKMVLNRGGVSKTYGPSKTVIVDTGDDQSTTTTTTAQ